MGMKDYIIRRSIQNVLLFLLAAVINFFLFHMMPGDPSTFLLPPSADSVTRRLLREKYGLDKPVTEQFVNYLRMIASGEFGYSFIYGGTVGEIIFGKKCFDSRFIHTMILIGTSMIFVILTKTLLDLMLARKRGVEFDLIASISSSVVYSIIVYLLSIIVILFYGIRLWIPNPQDPESLISVSFILRTMILIGALFVFATILVRVLLDLIATRKRGAEFDLITSISSSVVYSIVMFLVGFIVSVGLLILLYGIHPQLIPIEDFLDSRILHTLILMGSSLVLAIIIGTLLGLMAAWKQGSKFDYTVSITSLVIYSLPVFFVGLMVILFFGIQLGWIPITGTHTAFVEQTRLEFIVDYLHHLAAPMLVITLFFIPNYFIITRNSTLDIFSEDFIQTAEAKGLSDRQIVFKHAGKNSFLPTLSLIAIQMNYLVAGAMLTETVFSWPGIGRMTYEAILAPDYPLLEGMFLIIAAVVILSNFIADILYAVIDPRIRY